MILSSLYELYERLREDPSYTIAKPGYSLQKITFKVVIGETGNLVGIQDARQAIDGKDRPLLVEVPGKAKPSGSGLNPCFLWDNSQYMLGYKSGVEGSAGRTLERSRQASLAFRDRHLRLREEIDSPGFQAVCHFLSAWPGPSESERLLLDEIGSGFGVFQIVGQTAFVHQEAAVDRWWQSREETDQAPMGQCLVTGCTTSIARLHPKIKGVAGAQSSGATIAGFNDTAYGSYAKEQSFNAPVGEVAAARYTTALNTLLDGPQRNRHRLLLGDLTLAFWTDRPSMLEDVFSTFFGEGTAAATVEAQDEGLRLKLEIFLRALRDGRKAYDALVDEKTQFFILGLAPNAARISVRFFFRGSTHLLLDHLSQHQRDSAVLSMGSKSFPPREEVPPLWLLLAQSARVSKEIPPLLSAPLLKAVITGRRYPQGLYDAVLRRFRADRTINHPRACVVRGYLNRNHDLGVPMSLDPDRTDAAYRLGRLFAALEKTQADALPGLNSTIRDRYYGAASATPGSVFSRLLRTYQHHLSKMPDGYRIHRERLVQEILDPIAGFPAHLGLTDQGLFAIGYYHQMRHFYTKKTDTKITQPGGTAA